MIDITNRPDGEQTTAKQLGKMSEAQLVAAENKNLFPYWVLITTLILCFAPLLYGWGISWSSTAKPFDLQWLALQQLSDSHLIDEMFYTLRGDTLHVLLEWTAVVIAFICMAMAFVHFSLSRDITAPLLGLALVASGCMDAVHALAATRVIDTVAENSELIPFTWTISRAVNASVLMLGALLIVFGRGRALAYNMASMMILSIVLAVVVYTLATWMVLSDQLPKTHFPERLITHPYDVMPMIIFIACLPLFLMLYQKNKNYLTATILIALVPDIFSEIYMAFASTELFDHFFNASHCLKILSYALPLGGYLLDYKVMYLKQLKQQQDISNLNNSLLESEQRLRAITEQLPVGIFLVNVQGIIVSANQSAQSLFGYNTTDLLGHNIDKLVPIATQAHHQNLRAGYHRDPKVRQMAAEVDFLTGLHSDHSEIPLEIGLGPINLDGESHTLVTVVDVSERKRLLDDLKKQNIVMNQSIEKLAGSNEQLERFAFICSHDLQEPVRMVHSFCQLLESKLQGKLTEKEQEYFNYITDGAHRAREMINDVLLFCRVDQVVDKKSQVSLSGVCEQVHTTLQSDLTNLGMTFQWDQELPAIMAVPSQIFQLIMNLVSNGLKFNRSSEPTVRLTCCLQALHWRIDISDNGIGINKKYHEKIFHIFERLNAKTEFSGTGIGLAVCKKIAEQHHVDFSLISQEGKGTTFTLLWPISDGVEQNTV